MINSRNILFRIHFMPLILTFDTINTLPAVLRSRVNTRAEPEYLHENSIRGGVFLYDPAKLLLYFEIQLVDRV